MPELSDLPVVFISGYGNDETIAKALELGAADYIVKPFSPTELTARVRAALRRQAEPETFALGELQISYDRRRVTLAGRKLKLTAKEYDLLSVLSRNAGRVVTYETLLRQVWNRRGGGGPGAGANVREKAPPQARRRRGRPLIYPHRARRRLPHDRAGHGREPVTRAGPE